tara:strand:- start:937 stop:1233 length:297 start_codon:yes stop_codon:yes gene_type:complete
MKNCPTSNMNKSQLWGFEVSHIIVAFVMLAGSNTLLNVMQGPLILSWGMGIITLLTLRIISHGQKNGHLELLGRFIFEPHLFLGHQIGIKNGSKNEKV